MILLSHRAQPKTDIGYILVTELPESRKLRIHKLVIPRATSGTAKCRRSRLHTYPAARVTTDWGKVTCLRCLRWKPKGA